jgi:hypothetical protein
MSQYELPDAEIRIFVESLEHCLATFSSPRYSMTSCSSRWIQPATVKTKKEFRENRSGAYRPYVSSPDYASTSPSQSGVPVSAAKRSQKPSWAGVLAAKIPTVVLVPGIVMACSTQPSDRHRAVDGGTSPQGGQVATEGDPAAGGLAGADVSPSGGVVFADGTGGAASSGGSPDPSAEGAADGGGTTAGGSGGSQDTPAGGRGDVGAGAGIAGMPASRGAGGVAEAGHWAVARLEDFTSTRLSSTAWSADPVPDDGPFADEGVYFTHMGIFAPNAFRISQAFGSGNWLTLESYTRDSSRPLSDLASIVGDPADASNKVLRIRSPQHTDATIVRPSAALPTRYRVSLRVGYASFGDGTGDNGYDSGDETAEPWLDEDAVTENGFYWLTIVDTVPRPHNNVWIHHHRKVCIDSDNTTDDWMSVWNGDTCQVSGSHPVMLFALDGTSAGSPTSGQPFIAYRGGRWVSDICAVDAYQENRWYRVSIERFDNRFTISVAGDFVAGGDTSYTASIEAEDECVFHYNNAQLPSDHRCVDRGYYSEIGSEYPRWPSGVGYPDYFMFGEPHENYYEGTVYYDDVRLEVWEGD